MSPTDWAGLIVSIMTVTAGFAGAVRWLVRHYLSELKPNGGGSLNDRIKRLEEQLDRIYDILLESKR